MTSQSAGFVRWNRIRFLSTEQQVLRFAQDDNFILLTKSWLT
jgi:hypothetical protein